MLSYEMGNSGRFGKYGEMKRLDRLRLSRVSNTKYDVDSKIKPFRTRQSPGQHLHREQHIIVRPARVNETRFIKRLSRKLFNIYGPYEQIILGWFESDMTKTFIAFLDGQPVGFSMIGDMSSRYGLQHLAELLAIGIDPVKQARGIAAVLLREVERKAAKIGIKKIFLHTGTQNFQARRLFTQSGYITSEIKKGFYPEGQDAIVMYKDSLDNLLK